MRFGESRPRVTQGQVLCAAVFCLLAYLSAPVATFAVTLASGGIYSSSGPAFPGVPTGLLVGTDLAGNGKLPPASAIPPGELHDLVAALQAAAPSAVGALVFDDHFYGVDLNLGQSVGIMVSPPGLKAIPAVNGGTFLAHGSFSGHADSANPGVLSFDENGSFICCDSGFDDSGNCTEGPSLQTCFTAGAFTGFVGNLTNEAGTLLSSFLPSASTVTISGYLLNQGQFAGVNVSTGAFVINAIANAAPPTNTPVVPFTNTPTPTPTPTLKPGETPPPTDTPAPTPTPVPTSPGGNTQPGSNVTLSAGGAFLGPNGNSVDVSVDVTFAQVTAAGTTTISLTSSQPGKVPGFLAIGVNGYQGVFFDVSTTATINGEITVCSHYPDADNNGFVDGTGIPPKDPGVPESSLRILHRETVNGVPVFIDRTASLDTTNNTICAHTQGLSPFVVAVDTRIPGGGSAQTDCASEWAAGSGITYTKKGKPNNVLTCKDGQSSCDTNPTAGQCALSFKVCPNTTDARLQCTPTSIASYELSKPLPDAKDPTDAANAATILAALEALGPNTVAGKHGSVVTYTSALTASDCSASIAVTVPLKNGKKANRVIKLKAKRADGQVDTDTLTLTCTP